MSLRAAAQGHPASPMSTKRTDRWTGAQGDERRAMTVSTGGQRDETARTRTHRHTDTRTHGHTECAKYQVQQGLKRRVIARKRLFAAGKNVLGGCQGRADGFWVCGGIKCLHHKYNAAWYHDWGVMSKRCVSGKNALLRKKRGFLLGGRLQYRPLPLQESSVLQHEQVLQHEHQRQGHLTSRPGPCAAD